MPKTADDYRKEADAADKRARDSFERCDTDGFLSQWASGLSARLARRKAEILDNGGKATFTGLYEGDRRVKAKCLKGKFGWYWLLHESEKELIAKRGKPFLPTGKNSRVLKGLGLKERDELAPAWADYGGGGTGLAGATSVSIWNYRSGDKWGMDAELVKEDDDE